MFRLVPAMPVYAAVDIGSNSCRLKIARLQKHRLIPLYEDREVTRLGETVFRTGVLSPESMATTIKALKRFHRAVQEHAVDQLRVVATSALRDARNAAAFTTWVRSATGWKVEIISGLEEGRLIHAGVASLEQGMLGRAVLIDLGGGSCEITLSEQRRIREMVSLPLGAVRLTEEFLLHDPPAKDEVARMRQFIQRELRKAEKRIGAARVTTVIATSGTAAALVSASHELEGPGSRTNYASTKSVRKLAKKLTRLDDAERAEVPGIGPKRSEIIIAGAQVYGELLERLGLRGFRYSPMGLRDGVLVEIAAKQDLSARAHQQWEHERWESVLELARRYECDVRASQPVLAQVRQLFRELQKVHDLPAGYGFWLECAAVLHDAGKFLNYQGWHRHAQYAIANSELYGFTPEERAIVAAIARYLGKSRPEPDDRSMRSVPPEERQNVIKAIVLLRLAMALNQDRASDVLRFRTRLSPKRVELQLTPGRTGAELEMWALKKEAAYFREVFRRALLPALA